MAFEGRIAVHVRRNVMGELKSVMSSRDVFASTCTT